MINKKFRAWDKKKKMWNGTFILARNVVGDMEVFEDHQAYENDMPTDNLLVMQFIGFYDKKQRGIFEGDIVSWPGGRMEVAWKEVRQKWIPFIDSEAEVIGNIYDNADLLE